MKLDIIVNKYLLIWHLLYQSSVSREIHSLKQELWNDHKALYAKVHEDKDEILSSFDNFIPDDDLIYNLIESSPYYKKIKKDTNRYRLNILEIWDHNRKKYLKEIKSILKVSFPCEYKICVIHPDLDVVETDFDRKIITIGKKIITHDKDNFLSYLMYKIIKSEMSNYSYDDYSIFEAVCELCITNELYTRVTKFSKYNIGKKELRAIKEKIYPYFLMYLGVSFNDFDKYMVRDNIFFNKDSYEYIDLSSFDVFSFIDYLCKHKKSIFKVRQSLSNGLEVL